MFIKEQINPKNLRITLETLINIRWIAVIGQFFTVSFVYYGLKFQFPYFETLVLISLSALVNIYLELNKSRFVTINNFYTTVSIFYDLVQLIILLFMTGGLSNPFSILKFTPIFANPSRCKFTGLVPMAQPPGRATTACPNLANSGPRTKIEALIFFTIS